jgi:hypothetical protein
VAVETTAQVELPILAAEQAVILLVAQVVQAL